MPPPNHDQNHEQPVEADPPSHARPERARRIGSSLVTEKNVGASLAFVQPAITLFFTVTKPLKD